MITSLNIRAFSEAMARAGLSPAKLAARLGVSREAVSKWLHGESVPQPDKLLRLGMILGLKFEELVEMSAPAAGTVPVVKYRDSNRSPRHKKRPPRVAERAAAYGGPGGEIVLYQAPDGTVNLDVRLERETIWLTQAQMVVLFGRDQSVIARHLANVFADGELPTSESNMQRMHIAGA